jgi:hypothetical protein
MEKKFGWEKFVELCVEGNRDTESESDARLRARCEAYLGLEFEGVFAETIEELAMEVSRRKNISSQLAIKFLRLRKTEIKEVFDMSSKFTKLQEVDEY